MAKFITARYLAEILGITERRVNQIASEGRVFTRDLNGKFDVVECVAAYYKEKYVPADKNVNYDEEKALHEKAKREKAELLLAKMKNELHSAEDIELIMTNMIVTFRNKLLAIPSAIAPSLVRLKNINKISEMIDLKIREALLELSEYSPGMFGDGEDEDEPENNQFIQEDP